MNPPQVRAALSHFVLKGLSKLPRATMEAIEQRTTEDRMHAIVGTFALDWMPLEDHVALLEASREVTGDAAFKERARTGSTALFTSPLLRAMVEGSLKVLGTKPSALIRRAGPLYATCFRNAGEVTLVSAAADMDDVREAKLQLQRFPRELVRTGALFLGLSSAMEAISDLVDADVEVEHEDDGEDVWFQFRW